MVKIQMMTLNVNKKITHKLQITYFRGVHEL